MIVNRKCARRIALFGAALSLAAMIGCGGKKDDDGVSSKSAGTAPSDGQSVGTNNKPSLPPLDNTK